MQLTIIDEEEDGDYYEKEEEALNDKPTSMENKADDTNKQEDDCADNKQGETFVDKSPPPKTRY